MTTMKPQGRTTDAAQTAWNVAARHAYLVGIGGCGMCGLARMLVARGANVHGSDRVPSPITDALRDLDEIPIDFNQDEGNLPEQCDLLIVSAAIPPDHPQLLEAQRRGVDIITYAEALGRLMLGRTGVSIAGTHGKSTTTALLAHILIHCQKDPSFIVGATCAQIGGGSRTGAAPTIPGSSPARPAALLAEACEFNRSFHHHRPTVGAILNVEEDHLDVYGSLEAIIEAFHEFARLLPSQENGGYLLINHDGAHRRAIAAGLVCHVETIGWSPQADWSLERSSTDLRSLTIIRGDEVQVTMSCSIPGEHNAFNTAIASVLAHQLGCAWPDIAAAVESFEGVERRMECLGTRAVPGGDVLVYDDYGHHPTEIDTTLRALRAHEKPNRLVCVFQPHQHSRTRFLLEEFASSFSSADMVIVPHIYFVRDSEAEKQRVSAADLVDRLRKAGVQAMHLYPFEAIVEQLENVCRPGDLLVVMGAGPVWQVGHAFVRGGTNIDE